MPLILFANCCQAYNFDQVPDYDEKTHDSAKKENDSSKVVKQEKRKIADINDHDVKKKKGENNGTEIISPSQQDLTSEKLEKKIEGNPSESDEYFQYDDLLLLASYVEENFCFCRKTNYDECFNSLCKPVDNKNSNKIESIMLQVGINNSTVYTNLAIGYAYCKIKNNLFSKSNEIWTSFFAVLLRVF